MTTALSPGQASQESRTDDSVLDTLPDGVLVADADGVVRHANDMARRLLGTDDLVGRPLAEVVALQNLDGHEWYTLTDPYEGLNIRRMQAEQAWRLPDGTELLVTTRMCRRSPHHPVEQVAVSLRSARARDRLDRERSDLVATVAHELRSPLTGVRGFTGTLLARWDKFTDDQKKLIMQSVHSDTDRLTRLIAELLEVARIDTGRLSLYPRPLDVASAVEQVTQSVRAGTGREVHFEPEPDLPQILADPDRFAQVITNLVDNAVRHGEGMVRVTASPRQDDRWPSWSRTRGRASARRSASGSSRSSGSTAPAAGPGSACTSPTGWSPPTAGTSSSPTPGRRGPDRDVLAGVLCRLIPVRRLRRRFLHWRFLLRRFPHGRLQISSHGKATMSGPNTDYDPVAVTPLKAEEVEAMRDAALAAIESAGSLEELKQARLDHAGDRSPLALANREIGALPPQARKEAGQRVGQARGAVGQALAARQAVLEEEHEARILVEEAVDVTLALGPAADRRPAPGDHAVGADRGRVPGDGLGGRGGPARRGGVAELRRAQPRPGPSGPHHAGHVLDGPRRERDRAAHPHLARCRRGPC